MAEEKPIRQRVREEYIRRVKMGISFTLKDFCAQAPEIFGQNVDYRNARRWRQEENWFSEAQDVDFDASAELTQKKAFFDFAYQCVLAEKSAKELKSYAVMFLGCARAIPVHMRALIEDNVADVREHLQKFVEENEDAGAANLASLMATWRKLYPLLTIEAQEEDEGVEIDELVLSARETGK
jgi:hypothetical protein